MKQWKRWQRGLPCFVTILAILWSGIAILQNNKQRRIESVTAAYMDERFDSPYHIDEASYNLLMDIYIVPVTLETAEGPLSFEVHFDEGAISSDTYGEIVIERIFSHYLEGELITLGIREFRVSKLNAHPVRLTQEQYRTVAAMSAVEALKKVNIEDTQCIIDLLEHCTNEEAKEITASLATFFGEKHFQMYVNFSPTGDSEDMWYYSLSTNTKEPTLHKEKA